LLFKNNLLLNIKMNSRNMEKDSKQGWGRRDNRQQRFKKDFSGQEFYNNNNNDWNKNKQQLKKPADAPVKNDKSFNIQENLNNLTSREFKWIDNCVL